MLLKTTVITLGLCATLLVPVHAQTVITNGGLSTRNADGTMTTITNGGVQVQGRKRPASRSAVKSYHKNKARVSSRSRKGNATMNAHGIRVHQGDGQYGTIGKGGISGRDANGEKGTVGLGGISGH